MNKWLKAELDYWQSQKSQSLATLELYFNDSVGIGEHSDISKEIHDWTGKLSEAIENIQNLKEYFAKDGKVKTEKTLLKD